MKKTIKEKINDLVLEITEKDPEKKYRISDVVTLYEYRYDEKIKNAASFKNTCLEMIKKMAIKGDINIECLGQGRPTTFWKKDEKPKSVKTGDGLEKIIEEIHDSIGTMSISVSALNSKIPQIKEFQNSLSQLPVKLIAEEVSTSITEAVGSRILGVLKQELADWFAEQRKEMLARLDSINNRIGGVLAILNRISDVKVKNEKK